MHATEKALVLKVGRFREADVWVRLLTPARGVFNAFAFGGSRSRRRFVGCLDPLSHVLFTIGSSRQGDYTVLEEGSLLNNFPAVRAESSLTGVAVNCIKFVEALEVGTNDAQPVYDLLLETLETLEEGPAQSEFFPWLFRARLAFDIGFRPDFTTCGLCGRKVDGVEGHRFLVEKGLVGCPTCLSGGKPIDGLARPVSTGVLRALDWMQRSRPRDWANVAMDPEVRRQSLQAIELFVAYHLGLSWENGLYKKV